MSASLFTSAPAIVQRETPAASRGRVMSMVQASVVDAVGLVTPFLELSVAGGD